MNILQAEGVGGRQAETLPVRSLAFPGDLGHRTRQQTWAVLGHLRGPLLPGGLRT